MSSYFVFFLVNPRDVKKKIRIIAKGQNDVPIVDENLPTLISVIVLRAGHLLFFSRFVLC